MILWLGVLKAILTTKVERNLDAINIKPKKEPKNSGSFFLKEVSKKIYKIIS